MLIKNNLGNAIKLNGVYFFDNKENTSVKKRHDNWWMGLLGQWHHHKSPKLYEMMRKCIVQNAVP